MKRKLLSCVLSLVMVLSLLPTMALAEDASLPAAGEDGYILLGQDNATYKLTSHVTDLVVVTGKNVTIDLDGHNIAVDWDNADAAGVYMAVQVAGGSLTLKDRSNSVGTVSSKMTSGTNNQSQAVGVLVCNGGSLTLDSGKITATANSGRETFGVLVFSAKSGGAENSFTMNGGTVEAEYGVRVLYEGASFTMTGGTVKGDIAVSGHGDTKGDTSIDISGGTIIGEYQGIYQPQTGTLNISGGSISGWGGVEVKSGTVTISGGTITATGEKGLYEDNNMGTSSAGYAVAVVEDNDYKGQKVTIDGGEFSGGVAILNSAREEVYNSAQLKIKAGVFNDENLYENLIGDVCKTKTTDGYIVAQSHKYDPTKSVPVESATCTKTGVEKVFCTVCGEEGKEYTREVSALGHDYSIWVSSDTQHWKKCSRCDATTEKEDHESGTTCTTCGHNCSHTEVQNYEGKEPTCATEGYEPYIVCKTCGKHVVETSSGSGKYTVTSDTLVVIPKLAHTYTWKSTGSQHWQVCSECGDETAKLDHEYSGRTCTVCGYVKPSSSETTYAVSVNTAKNGSVSVSPKNAAKGTTVTVTTTPDKGWALETLTVLDRDGKEVDLTIVTVGEKYTFEMPSGKVTVSATFMEDNTMDL